MASSFLTGLTVTKELLGQVLEFMRALVPAFFLSVSFAGGSVTSSAGCSLMLISIRLVEWLFLTLFLPLIQMYILLVLAGHLIKEDLFSRTTELLEQGLVTCIASDAHGVTTRTPDLGDIYEYLAMEYSPELAELLLKNNPRRILQSKPLVKAQEILL